MNAQEALIAAQSQDCRILCPECSHTRKKAHEKTLSVTVNTTETLYDCHHCGYAGCIPVQSMSEQLRRYAAPKPKVSAIPTPLKANSPLIEKFFLDRGIPITDMSALPSMTTGKKFFVGIGEVDAVGFIYGNPKMPDAIKWRSVGSKHFTSENAARDFYGLDKLDVDAKTLIIVEGECDVVALATIGVRAISCPNGGSMKVSNRKIIPEEDKKFAFLWESRELLDNAEKIILAVDQDQAGDALAEEICRRTERAKCWRVKYPEGTKDATDVISVYGAKTMLAIIDGSEAMPLAGVYAASDYAHSVMEAYEHGYGHGESTGMKPVDELFTIKGGQLTIVTGLPGSGKSEFCDQIMLNLARDKAWKWAVASFENPCHVHQIKLAEKLVAKPFFEGTNPRITRPEIQEALGFINEHFVFLESRDGSLPTMSSIIDRAKSAIKRIGIRGLIIDPFNYITQETNEKSETKNISDMLTALTSFAKAYDVHVFFVAHPAKIYARDDGTYPVVKGMHISGSAAWFAKADLGVTVHRGNTGVEIHCWKSRFKWIGTQGMVTLGYDIPTGRYLDEMPTIPWGGELKKKIELNDLEF